MLQAGGRTFALLALILACWPGLETVERRSLVFAVLLQAIPGLPSLLLLAVASERQTLWRQSEA
jgi:hypothetical protein